MLRWALGIPPMHSDFDCSDGHWAFQLSIQISNAQMDIGHFTGAFGFRIVRLALGISAEHSDFDAQMGFGIQPEYSDFECSDGHWAFHRSIRIDFRKLAVLLDKFL